MQKINKLGRQFSLKSSPKTTHRQSYNAIHFLPKLIYMRIKSNYDVTGCNAQMVSLGPAKGSFVVYITHDSLAKLNLIWLINSTISTVSMQCSD